MRCCGRLAHTLYSLAEIGLLVFQDRMAKNRFIKQFHSQMHENIMGVSQSLCTHKIDLWVSMGDLRTLCLNRFVGTAQMAIKESLFLQMARQTQPLSPINPTMEDPSFDALLS